MNKIRHADSVAVCADKPQQVNVRRTVSLCSEQVVECTLHEGVAREVGRIVGDDRGGNDVRVIDILQWTCDRLTRDDVHFKAVIQCQRAFKIEVGRSSKYTQKTKYLQQTSTANGPLQLLQKPTTSKNWRVHRNGKPSSSDAKIILIINNIRYIQSVKQILYLQNVLWLINYQYTKKQKHILKISWKDRVSNEQVLCRMAEEKLHFRKILWNRNWQMLDVLRGSSGFNALLGLAGKFDGKRTMRPT